MDDKAWDDVANKVVTAVTTRPTNPATALTKPVWPRWLFGGVVVLSLGYIASGIHGYFWTPIGGGDAHLETAEKGLIEDYESRANALRERADSAHRVVAGCENGQPGPSCDQKTMDHARARAHDLDLRKDEAKAKAAELRAKPWRRHAEELRALANNRARFWSDLAWVLFFCLLAGAFATWKEQVAEKRAALNEVKDALRRYAVEQAELNEMRLGEFLKAPDARPELKKILEASPVITTLATSKVRTQWAAARSKLETREPRTLASYEMLIREMDKLLPPE